MLLQSNSFTSKSLIKKLSLCHTHKLSNPYIFTTRWRRPFIFQTYIIYYNRTHCLKYLRSTKSGCKDIGIRKFEFVHTAQLIH